MVVNSIYKIYTLKMEFSGYNWKVKLGAIQTLVAVPDAQLNVLDVIQLLRTFLAK